MSTVKGRRSVATAQGERVDAVSYLTSFEQASADFPTVAHGGALVTPVIPVLVAVVAPVRHLRILLARQRSR